MKLDEQYILYALGELEPEEEKEIELQLQNNPELMAEVEKIRRADGLLADVFAQSDESWDRNDMYEASYETTQSKVEAISCERTNLASRIPSLASQQQYEPKKKNAWRVLWTLATLILIAIGGVVMFTPYALRSHYIVYYSLCEDTAESMPAANSSSNVYSLISTENKNENDVTQMKEVDEGIVAYNAEEQSRRESHTLGLIKQVDSPSLYEEEHVYSVPALEETAPAPDMEVSVAEAAPVVEAAQPPVMAESEVPNDVFELAEVAPAEVANTPDVKNNVEHLIASDNIESDNLDSNESEYDPLIAMLLDSEMCKGCLEQIQRFNADNPLKSNAVYQKFAQQYTATKKQVLYGLFCSCVQTGDCLPVILNYFGLKVPDMTNRTVDDLSKDERFALAVEQFIDLVRKPKLRTTEKFKEILNLLSDSIGEDLKRLEFKSLVEKAMKLKGE